MIYERADDWIMKIWQPCFLATTIITNQDPIPSPFVVCSEHILEMRRVIKKILEDLEIESVEK